MVFGKSIEVSGGSPEIDATEKARVKMRTSGHLCTSVEAWGRMSTYSIRTKEPQRYSLRKESPWIWIDNGFMLEWM